MSQTVAIYEIGSLERVLLFALPLLIFATFVILLLVMIRSTKQRALRQAATRVTLEVSVSGKTLPPEPPLVRFCLPDGTEKEFLLPPNTYETLSVGDKGLLRLTDGHFVSFEPERQDEKEDET